MFNESFMMAFKNFVGKIYRIEVSSDKPKVLKQEVKIEHEENYTNEENLEKLKSCGRIFGKSFIMIIIDYGWFFCYVVSMSLAH